MEDVTKMTTAEMIQEMARLASTISAEWNEEQDGKGYPQNLPSFDEVSNSLVAWSEAQNS